MGFKIYIININKVNIDNGGILIRHLTQHLRSWYRVDPANVTLVTHYPTVLIMGKFSVLRNTVFSIAEPSKKTRHMRHAPQAMVDTFNPVT
jgi:hypothetical protein